ncbi:MAG: hypothetical protein HY530_06885 [Chloroflexi bacterium]|nr:hypothetical protein [Chloroflexota bacterium]
MTLEEEVKQFAVQQGADLVGIASVADINRYAPPGHRPDDILTGAKSVITFSKTRLVKGAWYSSDYRTPYYNNVWGILPGIATAVAQFIESEYGYYSVYQIPDIGLNPSLSLKLCAEMAGLGTRSMAAGIILNPKVGMLSIGACITTMPLKADGPMTEPVCPHPSCVKLWEKRHTTPCLDACHQCLSGEIAEGRIKWMRYDRRICATRAMTEGPSALLRALREAANEPDAGMRRSILLGSFTQRVFEMVAASTYYAQCFECTRNCPVCIEARTIRVKNTVQATVDAPKEVDANG